MPGTWTPECWSPGGSPTVSGVRGICHDDMDTFCCSTAVGHLAKRAALLTWLHHMNLHKKSKRFKRESINSRPPLAVVLTQSRLLPGWSLSLCQTVTSPPAPSSAALRPLQRNYPPPPLLSSHRRNFKAFFTVYNHQTYAFTSSDAVRKSSGRRHVKLSAAETNRDVRGKMSSRS